MATAVGGVGGVISRTSESSLSSKGHDGIRRTVETGWTRSSQGWQQNGEQVQELSPRPRAIWDCLAGRPPIDLLRSSHSYYFRDVLLTPLAAATTTRETHLAFFHSSLLLWLCLLSSCGVVTLQGTVKEGRRQGSKRKRWIQAWSSQSPRGQWRTGKNGGNWLQNHLWCPNDPRG